MPTFAATAVYAFLTDSIAGNAGFRRETLTMMEGWSTGDVLEWAKELDMGSKHKETIIQVLAHLNC